MLMTTLGCMGDYINKMYSGEGNTARLVEVFSLTILCFVCGDGCIGQGELLRIHAILI